MSRSFEKRLAAHCAAICNANNTAHDDATPPPLTAARWPVSGLYVHIYSNRSPVLFLLSYLRHIRRDTHTTLTSFGNACLVCQHAAARCSRAFLFCCAYSGTSLAGLGRRATVKPNRSGGGLRHPLHGARICSAHVEDNQIIIIGVRSMTQRATIGFSQH